MTKNDQTIVALGIRHAEVGAGAKLEVASTIALEILKRQPRFDASRFHQVVTGQREEM